MTETLRILVLFGNVPLLGQERGNIEALDALRSTGCEVLFLIRGPHTEDTIQAELRRRGHDWIIVPYFPAIRKGVPLRVWIENAWAIVTGSWRLLRIIRSFRATHIHVGNLDWILNFLPALAITKIALVFRAGDEPVIHNALFRGVWRFTIRRTAHFVAISRFIQEKLVANGVPREKTTVIYNRPPLHTVATAEVLPSKHTNNVIFSYVGQITRDKGVHVLVDAAIRLCREDDRPLFWIAGDYTWNNIFAESLIEKVKREGLSERIVFLGYRDDVPSLLGTCHVHICPSVLREALGNVIVEAKAASCPSIVFPTGGLPELIEHEVTGYICKSKAADSLIEAMRYYFADEARCREQGAAARNSLEKLGVHDFAMNWKRVYEGHF